LCFVFLCQWKKSVSQFFLASELGTGWPGVDVMITIFCDFRQFSAKKLAFFSITNVMIRSKFCII
jgi:hypothetical protein